MGRRSVSRKIRLTAPAWRGTAADMTVYEKPEKMAKRIETSLTKIVNKWKKMTAE